MKNGSNSISTANAERTQFSDRLQLALTNAGMSPSSPTKLAKAFNMLTDQPVTVHAARKWLVGEAIPTQAKLRILAEMLAVSVEWLRFGESAPSSATPIRDRLSRQNFELMSGIDRLKASDQLLVHGFVQMLVQRERAAVTP